MTEISTEELAQWLESIMVGPLCLAPLTNAEYNACSDALTEAAARLRALAEDAERLDFVGKGYVVVDATAGDTVVVEDHDIGSQDVDVYMYEAPTLRQAIDKARQIELAPVTSRLS